MIGHLDVGIVGNQVEHVLFEVRSRARNGCDVPGTDHVGQTSPNFRRAHRARQREKNPPAIFENLYE